MSNAELFAVSLKGTRVPSTSVAVGKSDFCSLTSFQTGGGLTITMPPHLGHARIWPTAAGSRTLSRDLQVVHVIAKRSMPIDYRSVARALKATFSSPLQNGL